MSDFYFKIEGKMMEINPSMKVIENMAGKMNNFKIFDPEIKTAQ